MKNFEIQTILRLAIEFRNNEMRVHFYYGLGTIKKYIKNRYSKEQKEWALSKAKEIGVRATSKLLKIQRKTIQRWLRENKCSVKSCPDWVRPWAKNRKYFLSFKVKKH